MSNYSENMKREIWSKGIETDFPIDEIRKDACGAWMRYDKYGDRTSPYGWEVDHIYPQSILEERGATQQEIDNIDNLRPMNWMNNDSKNNDYPDYHSRVNSSGNQNVEEDRFFTVAESIQNRLSQIYNKYMP